jgi:hypothetical protein
VESNLLPAGLPRRWATPEKKTRTKHFTPNERLVESLKYTTRIKAVRAQAVDAKLEDKRQKEHDCIPIVRAEVKDDLLAKKAT